MVTSLLTPLGQILAIWLLATAVTGTASADPPIPAVNTEQGLAVKGYDPVSYFVTGKPTLGFAQFATTYKGAIYRFSSAENRSNRGLVFESVRSPTLRDPPRNRNLVYDSASHA